MKVNRSFISFLGWTFAALLAATPGQADPVPVGHISDFQAASGSLNVSLTWADGAVLPATATLVLETTGGVPIASQGVTPAAGSQGVTLPGALAHFEADGGNYHLTLADDAGAPLDVEPFDVVYSCSDADHCTAKARPGGAGAPNTNLVSGELRDALDAAEASPTDDPLGRIKIARPDLIGEVYTFGERLRKAAVVVPDGPPQIGDCVCSWFAAKFLRPALAASIDDATGPISKHGEWGPGAAHATGVKYDGVITNAYRDVHLPMAGETELDLDIRCYKIARLEERMIELDGRMTLIYVPILEGRCATGCTGTVHNAAEYYASPRVEVDKSSLFLPSFAFAEALEEWRYTVNGGTVFANSKVFSQSDNGSKSPYLPDAGKSTVETPATALLHTFASTYARGISDDDARANTSNSLFLAMHGESECAHPNEVALWTYDSWEGKHAGLRINIKAFFSQFNMTDINP